MSLFRIRYEDPKTQERLWEVHAFEDWTGHATINGVQTGPEITITAEEWAKDVGYARADKGWHEVENIDEEVRRMHRDGWGVGQIAAKLQVTTEAIRKVIGT